MAKNSGNLRRFSENRYGEVARDSVAVVSKEPGEHAGFTG
jgi:hypothetical protein